MSVQFHNILCKICHSAILAGFIIFFTGAYYCVVKAGIPYQDPPLELQIQYAVHMGIGEILIKNGFMLILGSSLVRLVLRLAFRHPGKETNI